MTRRFFGRRGALGMRVASLLVVAQLALLPARAAAKSREGDPRAFDLRIAAFPVAFQVGISQSWFGSSLRAEYDVARWLCVGAFAHAPWWNVAGDRSRHGYSLGGTLMFHVHEDLEAEKLTGTVYPEQPAQIGGAGNPGIDHDLEMPISQRMGSGAPFATDYPEATALMRSLYSLRLGFSYVRDTQIVRYGTDDSSASDDLYAFNRVPMLTAGFSWERHWNIDRSITGKRQIGYRRFYGDLLGTLPALVRYDFLHVATADRTQPSVFAAGVRIGMEGAIDAFSDAAPGLGFAYSLELGALPGRPGLEGYLFLGLGMSFDFVTRRR